MIRIAHVGVVLFGLTLTGCASDPRAVDARGAESAPRADHDRRNAVATNQPERYDARGTVLWREPGRVYINHEEIPGFMDAMAMGFDVGDPALLEKIEPGASVEFRVVVKDDTFFIDQIHSLPP